MTRGVHQEEVLSFRHCEVKQGHHNSLLVILSLKVLKFKRRDFPANSFLFLWVKSDSPDQETF